MGLSLRGLIVAGVVAAGRAFAAAEQQIVRSLLDPRVSLSYKKVGALFWGAPSSLNFVQRADNSTLKTRICETTPGVNSYSGYVNLPANVTEGRMYDIHTFFWFFEARKNPNKAPLSLWLQGGPGAPSTPAVFGETGPCFVARDSKNTVLNPWSWTNEVNMLYLDQPVQTGFSYDTLINGTVDETQLPFVVTPLSAAAPIPPLNSTFLLGTFPSQNPKSTANTTSTAALAAWHFMQIWMQQYEFMAFCSLPATEAHSLAGSPSTNQRTTGSAFGPSHMVDTTAPPLLLSSPSRPARLEAELVPAARSHCGSTQSGSSTAASTFSRRFPPTLGWRTTIHTESRSSARPSTTLPSTASRNAVIESIRVNIWQTQRTQGAWATLRKSTKLALMPTISAWGPWQEVWKAGE